MFLVPFMTLNELISNLWILKADMSPYIKLGKHVMNFFKLVFSGNSSVSAVEITDYHILVISTVFLQKFLVSIYDKLFICRCNTDQLDHFMNHDSFFACFLEVYLQNIYNVDVTKSQEH